MSMRPPRLVLVGAGHAHLHVVRHLAAFTHHGMQVMLIDPGCFWYSGLATGMLAGQYPCEADWIDPAPLIEQAGGAFMRDRIEALDVKARLAHTAGGRCLAWDAISFNIGSEVATDAIHGAVEHAWPVKPIAGLCRLRYRLADLFQEHRHPRITVVGGGPTACEVAAGIEQLAHAYGAAIHLRLCSSAARLIADWPARASSALARELHSRSIRIENECRIIRCASDHVEAADGRQHESDLTVLATGLRAPSVTGNLGLPADRAHGLHVNACLQSTAHLSIFGAGDCIHFADRPLPKVGVYGVRAGPVLRDNLLAVLRGRPLRPFRPQRRYLVILNLGRGRALAMRGRWWWLGRGPMWWKHWLDHRFMQRHRHRKRK